MFSVGIVVLYGLLFAVFLNRSGPKDHDQFLVFHELQLWNSLLFGLAKQWSPVMCSGLSLAGEPQVPFMSLSMALTYLLGPLAGIKLATLVYFVAGWVGAFLYAGLWLKQFGQRALAASLFIGNGFFICRFGFGHIDFIPFLTLPALLWALHRATTWRQQVGTAQNAVRLAMTALLMAGVIAVAIDGSPVAIIHLLFWVGLYALIFAWTVRSLAPLTLFLCAAGMAAMLDAGYLWPMLEAQAQFPRQTEDQFSSALSLLWFALLPVRGKVLPANGNGHELSVFIGPVIAYLLWAYRHSLAASLPRSMKLPLLVVCSVSIVLGMGSLKPLHVPTWLSPFDILRPLPGFRSIGVTGRFWGFLALPLSLLGAAALWRFAAEFQHTKRLHLWLGCALTLQLGFQTETVLSQWLGTNPYQAVAVADQFRGGGEEIEYVTTDESLPQGAFITPTRSVLNCYDMDDFIRAEMAPGRQIVQAVSGDRESQRALTASGKFAGWNHLQLAVQDAAAANSTAAPTGVKLVLNQAFNRSWRASGCTTARGERGNLIVDCPAERVRQGSIDLVFHNDVSAEAAMVSVTAWRLWLVLLGGALFGSFACYAEFSLRRRGIRLPR